MQNDSRGAKNIPQVFVPLQEGPTQPGGQLLSLAADAIYAMGENNPQFMKVPDWLEANLYLQIPRASTAGLDTGLGLKSV